MADLRLCSIADCGKAVAAKGLCDRHYRKALWYGDPLAVDQRLKPKRTCSIEGCGQSAYWRDGGRRGWRDAHYQRWHKHGDPRTLMKVADGYLEVWLREHVSFTGSECLIWPFGKGPKGYAGDATVNGESDSAHRHMCALAHGPAPTLKHEVAHSCGKGLDGCVNPWHLRWDTHIANMADRLIHDTHGRGERSATAVLTEADVRRIRELCCTMKQREVAAIYGVHRATIGAIIRGKSWAWLK